MRRAAPDRPSLLDLLDQGEIWIDAGGREHRIADMDGVYWNTLKGSSPQGEIASGAVDAMLAELEAALADPLAWARHRPLMEALEQHIGDVAERGVSRTVTATVCG